MVNNQGELIALAVGVTFVQDQGFIVTQDNFGLATEFIQTVLPVLTDGLVRVEPRPKPTPDPGSPPPFTAIYSGL